MAKRLGGQRNGNRGTATPDVSNDWLQVECKARKQLPTWIKAALAQVLQHVGAGQLGIVVLHEHGKRADNDLVVMRLADFENWFGGNDSHA